MTGYPAREDAQHFESLEEQKQVWFALIHENTFEEIRRGAWEGNPLVKPELALEIDCPAWYEKYLELDAPAFFTMYFRKNQITPALDFQPDRLYFGNAFCPHLFPSERILQKLIEKACREHFVVTLVFPILQERKRHETEYLLEMLDNWCGRIRRNWKSS